MLFVSKQHNPRNMLVSDFVEICVTPLLASLVFFHLVQSSPTSRIREEENFQDFNDIALTSDDSVRHKRKCPVLLYHNTSHMDFACFSYTGYKSVDKRCRSSFEWTRLLAGKSVAEGRSVSF